jgi:hypothetical protein
MLFMETCRSRICGVDVYICWQWELPMTNTHDAAQDEVEELIAFFYDLIRDEPVVVAKVDGAFRKRYGYDGTP